VEKRDWPLCPSTFPGWPDSVAFGIVTGTVEDPRWQPFEKPLPITDELLSLSGPVAPTEIFRFAGPCAGKACMHFQEGSGRCRLVEKTVRFVPVVQEKLPSCTIRPDCKWWRQEGRDACFRCPQVASSNPANAEALRMASDPSVL
jgi:hypothetical protein